MLLLAADIIQSLIQFLFFLILRNIQLAPQNCLFYLCYSHLACLSRDGLDALLAEARGCSYSQPINGTQMERLLWPQSRTDEQPLFRKLQVRIRFIYIFF